MADLISRVLALTWIARLKVRLTRSDITRRFSRGVFWTLMGNITWRLLSAISTITVARILGTQGFGELGMIQSTVRMFSIYAGFRMGVTSTKYIAEYKTKDPQKAARILKLTLVVSFIMCISVAAIIFFTAPYLASRLLKHPELSVGLSVGALLLFSLVYGEIKLYALSGFENFKAIAKINALRGLVTPLSCIPLAYFWGVEGALAGFTLVSTLVLINGSIILNRERANANFPDKVQLGDAKQELPIIWRFALPGLIVGILITAMTWFGRVFLVRQESGYVELGLFEAAYQWQMLILFLPAILVRVILPILSETYGKEEKKEFSSAISMQLQSICLVILPLTIIVVGFSKQLALIYGEQFEGTEIVIPVLMLSVFFDAMNQGVRQIYDGAGKRWTNLAMYLIWASVYFFSCLTFIPAMGAVGFALTHLIADSILLLVQSLYVDFYLVPTVMRRQLKLFVFSLILVGTCYFAQSQLSGILAILVVLGLFMLGLLPTLLKFKIISFEKHSF